MSIDNTSANFVNILTDLAKSNDISYALKSKNFPVYKYASLHTSKEIRQTTMASDRVQQAITQTAAERNLSRKKAEAEATKIADEMFQNFNMLYPRMLVVLAKRCLPRIFSAVYVDSVEKVQKIRQLAVDDPILFVPSHRTYMDFILLQFVCFHFEIPLPAIASAIDFMRMKFMGEMLRRSGAYFIRRSFKDDFLYRTIFTEYVQTQIRDGDRPLEVFVEGTRSRTGKSLYPKYGFLATVLEPYLTKQVYDIKVVPVNLSFSKTLEESLYAYELLGFSKPPESMSGLLKARSVLDTNYGDVFITFGDPISVREYFNAASAVDPTRHHLTTFFEMTKDEKSAVYSLAHKIVKRQESYAVLNVWSLAALQMNAMIARGSNSSDVAPSVNYGMLLERVNELYDLLVRLSCRIPLRTGSLAEELNYLVNLHKNIVQLNPNGRFIKLPAAAEPLASPYFDSSLIFMRSLIGPAVPRLMLANFGNECMHVLVEICFLAVNFDDRNLHERPLDQLYDDFHFLRTLYARDFVNEPSQSRECFKLTLERCVEAKIFSISADGKVLTCNGASDVDVLKTIFEPWLIAYSIYADFLYQHRIAIAEKNYYRIVQDGIAKKFKDARTNESRWYQILSLDTMKNALHSFVDVGAVVKVKEQGATVAVVDPHHSSFQSNGERLDELKRRLENYLYSCYSARDTKLKAKL